MFLSGGMSSHVQQLQFLSNQVQAIRQASPPLVAWRLARAELVGAMRAELLLMCRADPSVVPLLVLVLLQVRDGRLPAHLLLSDRDFDENDYEALLALDEGIENHKVMRNGFSFDREASPISKAAPLGSPLLYVFGSVVATVLLLSFRWVLLFCDCRERRRGTSRP